MRAVAVLFGISESTAHNIINIFMDFLVEIAPTIIYMPSTDDEKEKATFEFSKV